MYLPRLVHFCNRSVKHNKEEGVSRLLSILRHGALIPKQWGVLKDATVEQFFNSSPWLTEEQKQYHAVQHEERLRIAGRVGPAREAFDAKTVRVDRERKDWLLSLRYSMVSFTDANESDLLALSKTFGSIGIALKPGTRPAVLCEPVCYVSSFASPLHLASMSHLICSYLTKYIEGMEPIKGLEPIDNPAKALVYSLEVIESRRMALFQDMNHISEHEWRFIQNDYDKELAFEPADLDCVLVGDDVYARALTHDLSNGSDAIKRYIDARVPILSIEQYINQLK